MSEEKTPFDLDAILPDSKIPVYVKSPAPPSTQGGVSRRYTMVPHS